MANSDSNLIAVAGFAKFFGQMVRLFGQCRVMRSVSESKALDTVAAIGREALTGCSNG